MAMTDEARSQANQTFELRIEFGPGDEVPLTVFARSLQDVKDILDQIAADLTQGSAHISWLLRIAPVIQVTAHVNGVGPDVLRSVVGESFQSIIGTQGHDSPGPVEGIGEKVSESAKRLVRRLAQQGEPVTVGATDKPTVVIDPEPAARPSRTRPRIYVSWSTVDGYLEVISVHRQPRFVLYEHGSERAVQCILPDHMMSQLKDWLGQRVRVDGRVHFRRDGTPAVITEVTSVSVVKRASRDISELSGSISSKVDSEDVVARLRGKSVD